MPETQSHCTWIGELPLDLQKVVTPLGPLVEHLHAELEALGSGDVRYASSTSDGTWQDCTGQMMHDKRNLCATLELVQAALEQQFQ